MRFVVYIASSVNSPALNADVLDYNPYIGGGEGVNRFLATG